jgi:hypothetical protein
MNPIIIAVLGMGSKTVSTGIEQETLDAVDALVKLGIFKSRSEALKILIKIGLSSVGDVVNVVKISERLFELERTLGYIPVRLDGGFKDLMEMRERFY